MTTTPKYSPLNAPGVEPRSYKDVDHQEVLEKCVSAVHTRLGLLNLRKVMKISANEIKDKTEGTIYDLLLFRIDKRIGLLRQANSRLRSQLLEDKILSNKIARIARSRRRIVEIMNDKKDSGN